MHFLKGVSRPIRSQVSGGLLAVALLGAVGESSLLAVLFLQQQLVDRGIRDAGSVSQLLALSMAVLLIIGGFQSFVTLVRARFLSRRRSERSARLLVNKLMGRRESSLSAGSVETSVLDRLTEEFDRGVLLLFSSLFRAVGAIVYAAYISLWFALSAVVLLVIAMWFAKRSTERLPALGRKVQEASTQFIDNQRSLVQNIQSFSLLGLEARLLKRFRQLDDRFLSDRQSLSAAAVRANTGAVVAYGVQKVALIMLLAFLFAQEAITVGQLIAGVFLVTLISLPITQFTSAVASVRGAVKLFKSIEPEQPIAQEMEVALEPHGLSVQVASLYSPSGETLLEDSSVLLEKGRLYALTGSNGSGKSTLLRELYWALADSDVGVAYLDQSAQLFPGNVRDNLAWSHNTSEAYRLWQEACPHITMDSPVSRSSQGLSSGERQKLLLVRTLASDCDVALLDEGLRSLDAESRDAMVATIRRLADSTGLIVVCSIHPDAGGVKGFDADLHLEKGAMALRMTYTLEGASLD